MTLNTLWVGPKPSRLVQRCINSLPNSGMDVVLYTYTPAALQPLFPTITVRDASTVLPQSHVFTYNVGPGKGSYAAFANLFRYVLLADAGGWWVDTDVYWLRPYTNTAPYVLVAEPGKTKLLHNGILCVPPKSALMATMVERAVATDTRKMAWGTTGSRLLTRTINECYQPLQEYVVDAATFCPIHWADVCDRAQYPARIALAPHTVAVHLFNEMWRRNGLDPDQDYPIFDHLQTEALPCEV
jgi:hypothetical protein